MPSKSDKQQRFFKWVQAVQNGSAKKKDAPKSVIDAAKNMTKKQVSDFADHVVKKKKKKVNEMYVLSYDAFNEKLKATSIDLSDIKNISVGPTEIKIDDTNFENLSHEQQLTKLASNRYNSTLKRIKTSKCMEIYHRDNIKNLHFDITEFFTNLDNCYTDKNTYDSLDKDTCLVAYADIEDKWDICVLLAFKVEPYPNKFYQLKQNAYLYFVDAVKDLIMNLEEPIFSGDEWETTDLIHYTSNCCYVLIPLLWAGVYERRDVTGHEFYRFLQYIEKLVHEIDIALRDIANKTIEKNK